MELKLEMELKLNSAPLKYPLGGSSWWHVPEPLQYDDGWHGVFGLAAGPTAAPQHVLASAAPSPSPSATPPMAVSIFLRV